MKWHLWHRIRGHLLGFAQTDWYPGPREGEFRADVYDACSCGKIWWVE